MAQFNFENDDREEIRPTGRQPAGRRSGGAGESLNEFMAFCVRLMGIFMLIVGLWMGFKVILEAWALYRSPQHIEQFADVIERGSNLDSVLASFTSSKPKSNLSAEGKTQLVEPEQKNIRLTYFLAWMIAIFLLMIIGHLAFTAIRTGGQLALYDLQVKKIARELIREVRQPDKRH